MQTSSELFNLAQQHIPGGVNSPVRAFKGVGGDPIFMSRGAGAYLYDVDGKAYIDYVGSWGPIILGHAHPEVVAAVGQALQNGLSFGTPTASEIDLARKIKELMPSMEMIRMVNSGTEATMTAIRLARGYTERDKMIKFAGCYHGHADSLLVNAGSGALTLGVPSSPGVPASTAEHTLVADFNQLDQVAQMFEQYPNDIACVIVEPIAGNMNLVPPVPGFLEGLRALCDHYHAVLIFDEVMTGFRVALGGAQALYNVTPDLTTLGKVIGGGMPVGAFGGKKEIMSSIAPLGPVYQAGTLSGNPLAMAAGLETLELLSAPDFHQRLSVMTQTLVDGLAHRAEAAKLNLLTRSIGGMFGLLFTEQMQVNDLQAVSACHINQFQTFFHGMLGEGCYFAPSAYEACFMSSAHGDKEIEKTLASAESVFATV